MTTTDAEVRARAIDVLAAALAEGGDPAQARELATGFVDAAIAEREAGQGEASRAFNPRELRDRTGKWTKGGGALSPAADEGNDLGWNPPGHPRSTRDDEEDYPQPRGSAAGGWSAAARSLVAESDGADTVAKYMREDGSWSPERQALHQRIVEEALKGVTPSGNPTATFLGGGAASGKSTALAGRTAGNEVTIDSDAIKGKLPEYQDMTGKGDPNAAAYAHEESSYLAKVIQAEAIDRGYNFLLDGTGDASYAKMRKKLEAAQKAGYKTSARYVTVDTDTAIARAEARAQKTGRMVPPAVIAQTHASVTDVFAKLVADDLADDIQLWDTNGPKPVLVGEKTSGGKWALKDRGAWDRFLAKSAPQVSRAVMLTAGDDDRLDLVDVDALVRGAEEDADWLEVDLAGELSRFNPNHGPGGLFASGPGGSGAPATAQQKQQHAKEAKRLRHEAAGLREQARRLAAELHGFLAQLHASAAAARHHRAMAAKTAKATKAGAAKAKHGVHAKKARAGQGKAKTAAQHKATARGHATTTAALRKKIAGLRGQIHDLRQRANTLDAKAAKL